jgi:hypothetical protein
MLHAIGKKMPFVLSNIGVMVILHGNSKQFWPKIPYLSLRDESIPEHVRLIFNTLLLVTVGQTILRQMPMSRVPARLITMGTIPISLPLLLGFGERVLSLKEQQARVYHLSLVLALPIAAAILEDGIVELLQVSA